MKRYLIEARNALIGLPTRLKAFLAVMVALHVIVSGFGTIDQEHVSYTILWIALLLVSYIERVELLLMTWWPRSEKQTVQQHSLE